MSIVTYEVNSKRKSQRVGIPIYLAIKSTLYHVKDWSLLGLAIVSQEDLKLKKDDIINSTIILPLNCAKLHLETQLKFVNKRDDGYGFEYVKMPEKNKNVLRHFIQLAIEGKADSLQDLLADYAMPQIDSPIKEPIALSENEKKELKVTFKKNFFIFLFFGIIVFSLILVTFFYNIAINTHTTGISTGNYDKYYATTNGEIEFINVHENDKILKNSILFKIKPNTTKPFVDSNNLAYLEEIKLLEEKLKQYQDELNSLQPSNKYNLISINTELPELKRVYENAKKEYADAQKLLSAKMLIKSEFLKIEDKYLSSKNKYDSALAKKLALKNEISDGLTQKKDKLQFLINKTQKKIEAKNLNNNTKIADTLDTLPSVARNDGIINYIKFRKGEFVQSSDLILVIETDTKPYILIKIPLKESMNLSATFDCIISSKLNNIKYKGKISKLDYIASDDVSLIAKYVKANEVVIRIDLDDDIARLPLNGRVDVWIVNKNLIGDFFVENIFFTNNQLLSWIWR